MPEQQEAQNVIDNLRGSKKLHDEIASKFRSQYLVSGKLIGEWKEYFRIYIPPDLNTETCMRLGMKIMELHQEATYWKVEAEARLSACKRIADDKYEAHINGIVEEYHVNNKKLPAKDILATMAGSIISELRGTVLHAEIEVNFWKGIIADLANARKLIENATMNIGIEAKALQTSKLINKYNDEGV